MNMAREPAPARRPGLGFLALAVTAVAALTGLGAWQVERLQWKRALIADRQAMLALPPVAVSDLRDAPDIASYRPARLTGVLLHDREFLVGPRVRRGRPGWHVVTPLRLARGGIVLVDRGWVPEALKRAARRPAGQTAGTVNLQGIVRRPPPTGWFAPDNEPGKDQWFRIAPRAMAEAAGLGVVAPWWLQAGSVPRATGRPRGDAGVPMPPDNHLHYAITWFSLALAAAVIAAVLWRRARG